jgi:hypothetical protein
LRNGELRFAGTLVAVAQRFVQLLPAKLRIRPELELAEVRYRRLVASRFHHGLGNEAAKKPGYNTHFDIS